MHEAIHYQPGSFEQRKYQIKAKEYQTQLKNGLIIRFEADRTIKLPNDLLTYALSDEFKIQLTLAMGLLEEIEAKDKRDLYNKVKALLETETDEDKKSFYRLCLRRDLGWWVKVKFLSRGRLIFSGLKLEKEKSSHFSF